MSIALLIAAAAAQAGGVAVENVPQIGIATRHARCIVRRVGVAPAEEAARTERVASASRECRAYLESDYNARRVTVGGRPVNARWWRRMQSTLDAVEADVTAAVAAPSHYKIIWELPDGGRVDAYTAGEPLTRVRLLTVPL